MGWGTESLVGVKLKIAVMMPTLEGKGRALIVKEFKVILIFCWSWDKGKLEMVSIFFSGGLFVRIDDMFGFVISNRAYLEKKEVMREVLLMVGQGGGQGIFDCLLIKMIGDFGMEDLEEDVETS
jgi:hypothetical protein